MRAGAQVGQPRRRQEPAVRVRASAHGHSSVRSKAGRVAGRSSALCPALSFESMCALMQLVTHIRRNRKSGPKSGVSQAAPLTAVANYLSPSPLCFSSGIPPRVELVGL